MHYSRKITKLIPDRRRRWGKVSAESSLMFGGRAYLIRRGGTQARAVVVLSPMTAFRGKTENTRARDFFFSSLPFLKKKKKFPSRSVNKIFILSSRDKYANKRGKERERERERKATRKAMTAVKTKVCTIKRHFSQIKILCSYNARARAAGRREEAIARKIVHAPAREFAHALRNNRSLLLPLYISLSLYSSDI